MNIKQFLWITPFFSFCLGYLIMQQLLHIPATITPHLIGKQVHAILPLVTQHNLNLRLIDQKEEADIPEGVILNQTPIAGTTIKPNQPLFIVTTKKPIAIHAPHCVQLHIHELHKQLYNQEIHPCVYHLPHPYPENLCFAQSPQQNEPLEKNKLTLYISSGNNKPIIWPDFTNMPLDVVINFLNNYHIEPHIIGEARPHHAHMEYVVIDQRPFAGTLLTLDETKPLSVQLRVNLTKDNYE